MLSHVCKLKAYVTANDLEQFFTSNVVGNKIYMIPLIVIYIFMSNICCIL